MKTERQPYYYLGEYWEIERVTLDAIIYRSADGKKMLHRFYTGEHKVEKKEVKR